MTSQQRFHHYLVQAQELCTNANKMPYLCVIGTHDFDELFEECKRHVIATKFRERVDERIAYEWNPFNTSNVDFEEFRERVEQEEFDKMKVGSEPSGSPLVAEAEAAMDLRQRAPQTEHFEFCGCKCFRSLCDARGFWFA